MLIVCEGKKTEPTYFKSLIRRLRLSTANVEVEGSSSDPSRLVKRAKSLRKKEQGQGDRYDSVYCVFDEDEHEHFAKASEEARSARVKLARSWPCFEFWVLLHFTYIRRPYMRSGDKSPGQNCLSDLRKYMPSYTKGDAGVFEELEDLLETGKSNARRALSDAEATGRRSPSTEVHCLVAYLQALKVT